jgi:O-acetylhomoserine/O-acetylserine sulfhydrylase-like pyridoxal-dependent enzyme
MRSLDVRMLTKCINTQILAAVFHEHPAINVHCAALPTSGNYDLTQRLLYLGLPAPLFTIDIDGIPREAFARFFDCLTPTFGHMISLGQANTIVSCPALTTHSELDNAALASAGIRPTTIRFAVGDEDPKDLIAHFISAARLAIDPDVPRFSDQFPSPETIDGMVRECYVKAHKKHVDAQRPMADVLAGRSE